MTRILAVFANVWAAIREMARTDPRELARATYEWLTGWTTTLALVALWVLWAALMAFTLGILGAPDG